VANLSSIERATRVINEEHITPDAKLGVFTMQGTVDPRVVRLFPTESCSHLAAGSCYHLLAAKKVVGLSQPFKKRTLNLTQLRKNTRKRPDKTSDRKRPRTADVDVEAAPDADSEGCNAGVADLDDVKPNETPAATITKQNICHTCHQPARAAHIGVLYTGFGVTYALAGITRYVLAYEIRTMITSATSVSSYFLQCVLLYLDF